MSGSSKSSGAGRGVDRHDTGSSSGAGGRPAAGAVPPPHTLREYALLADGERGALVGPRGDISWLCVPKWHDPSVFGALIGGTGFYAVEPRDRYVWGGFYEGASMIWVSRWITTHGEIECREALQYPADPDRAVILRRIRAVNGPAVLDVRLAPRGDYDCTAMSDVHRHDGVWTARAGHASLRWLGAPNARHRGDALVTEIELQPGEQHDLVLEIAGGDAAIEGPLPDPDTAWNATEASWKRDVPSLDSVLSPSDARRTYAVLTGLTSHGGGMVAAATTSLPERAEAGRNYDYRYVWIRDQCYVGHAGAETGCPGLLDPAVRFVTERLLDAGDRMAPAYTVDGDPVPDQRHLDLPGYPGGSDIVGNWVNQQFQLDAFGEALLMLARAAELDRLDDDGRRAMDVAARAVEKRWRQPDAGIWEIDDRPWTHSRLISAAGLRAAARTMGPGPGAHWSALADTITAHTAAHATHPDGRWQRSPDDPRVDAALLLPPLRGAVAMDDPRTVATLEAYLHDLTRDGYAYRFRHDDRPLWQAEGSFLLCGYLTALSLHAVGDPVEARAWLERTASACGPPQLFSEEYDARQHQMRGNVPQAFVHALMLEASGRLAKS